MPAKHSPIIITLFAAVLTACTATTESGSSLPTSSAIRAVAVDGDTIRVADRTIRLHGIDAPEYNQSCARTGGGTWPCGQQAKVTLANLLQGQQLECRSVDVDRYQREVAKCFVGGRDLGQAMVRDGMAWAYTRYSSDYVQDEATARSGRRGIWQADTPRASEVRTARQTTVKASPPATNCAIKGNISQRGQRIYHTPGSREYAKTRVNQSRGERWLCSESEAVAAGWRRAR